MGINNDGFSGVEIEQIALEKNVLVGVQCPNLTPSVKVEVNGQALPVATITKDGGMTIDPGFGMACSYADTSWLSHGGIYSMTSGNKMNFTTGAGGFEFISCGPLKINSALVDFFTTYAVNIKSRLFTVASTERTHLMGKRIDFDYDETYFTGNTNFINNMALNGSVFVNGELYCTHMTSMGQTNSTQPSPDLTGYINPGQSFVAFNGASNAAKSLQPQVDCTITLQFPEPISKLLTIPCKLSFTNGLSFASDATIEKCKETTGVIAQGSARSCDVKTSDLMGSGHTHEFIGPSCSYVKDTSAVFEEARQMMESRTPSKAKPTTPGGCTSWEEYANQCKEALTNAGTKFLSNAANYILNIFPSNE